MTQDNGAVTRPGTRMEHTAKGGAMGEENGFVERPNKRWATRQPNERTRLLMQTAENGKAIRWPKDRADSVLATLRKYGLRAHVAKQPDGTYLAWCERLEAQ